jgi:TldD protein
LKTPVATLTSTIPSSLLECSTCLESLLAAGRGAGADLVEVFLERTDHLGLLAEQDTLTSVSPAFGIGAGIRVFLGSMDGFVSTNDLSDAALFSALDQALGMLGLQRNGAASPRFEGLQPLRDYAGDKGDWLQRCPLLQEASSRLLEGTDLLQRHGRHLQVRRGSYARDWQEVLVAASDGTHAHDIRLHQSLGLNVLAADGDHRASLGRRYGTTDQPDEVGCFDGGQPRHAGGERTHPGDHETICRHDRVGISGDLDRRPGPLEGALRGAEIAGAVVEDDYGHQVALHA